MTIGFRQIPADIRVPGVYVEIDASDAGATQPPFRALLIGQRLDTGRVAAAAPTQIASKEGAAEAFGPGSMLAQMAATFRDQNPYGELWAVALDDAAGAVKAAWTVQATAAASAAGTIALYVGGRRIPVAIAAAATVNEIATAIKNAVTGAGIDVPATAASATDTATLTARHGGAAPDLTVAINQLPGESLPPGVALTITNSVAGATDPTLTTALDAVADMRFGLVVTPYNAAAAMTSIENELADRWTALNALDGVAVTAVRGTASAVTTWGGTRNSAFSLGMDAATSPTPTYEWAAAVAGAAAATAAADPALPSSTVPLKGIRAPLPGARRDATERETFLQGGVATHAVDDGGQVSIERLITTYQTVGGQHDDAWLDLTTPLTLSHLRQDFGARLSKKYGQAKVAGDDQRGRPGQLIATPKSVRAETVAWWQDMYDRGLVEGFDAFRRGLLVQRSQQNQTRLDILMPADIVNPLHVIGVRLDFRL